jgi:L-aspartate oxidase
MSSRNSWSTTAASGWKRSAGARRSDGEVTNCHHGSDVVVAAGGVGHLYEVTTNPTEARGGGVGMAARAGARMADLEFVQFHPTAINVGKDPAPLATEALRGHGATLLNGGERFMVPIHPTPNWRRETSSRAASSPKSRPAVARFSIAPRRLARLSPRSFRPSTATAGRRGSTRSPNRFPVIPAAHYFMGGIWTDHDGRTSLPGLWACGEVTSTGAHGANRLASNSLLEAVVFSARDRHGLANEAPDASPEWSGRFRRQR